LGKKKNIKDNIAVIVSDFNKEITGGLLNGALKVLKENGLDDKKIKIYRCPGAFEIPFIAKKICKTKNYSAVICLGAVIKGETAHFEYISYAVTKGILQINLQFDIPVIFGVLTCYSEKQAIERSSDNSENKGAEAAMAALDMIRLSI
jgi:6,7-dimethyl-8-ribityllumazine synthase